MIQRSYTSVLVTLAVLIAATPICITVYCETLATTIIHCVTMDGVPAGKVWSQRAGAVQAARKIHASRYVMERVAHRLPRHDRTSLPVLFEYIDYSGHLTPSMDAYLRSVIADKDVHPGFAEDAKYLRATYGPPTKATP